MTDHTLAKRTFESIGLIVIGYFLFALTDSLQKYFGAQGFSVNYIIVYCAGASLIFSTSAIFFMKGLKGFIPRKSIKLHALRAALMIIGSYAIVTALQMIPLAQFYGIVFSIPFLISLGAIIMFKEHPGMQRWIAISVGFIGVWIVANPDFSNINPGILWAVLASFSIAASSLVARKMGPGEFMPIYPFLIHAGILMVNSFFVEEYTIPSPWLITLFLCAGFCLFFAMICITIAYTIAPLAAIPAPFQYTQIIWGILFGYFIFNEMIDPRSIIGICIIIASGVYLIWREYVNNKSRQRNKFRSYTRP